MSAGPFVPEAFVVPAPPETAEFRLVPLGPEHNEADHAAWTSSVGHIRATPGFAGHGWPTTERMSLAQNRDDLVRHAEDFAARRGFTYTVLAPGSDEVLGCVYIYPARDEDHDAAVRSWVRADVAALDDLLFGLVSRWLASQWPFTRVAYR